mgnify:CR=1 FL=1
MSHPERHRQHRVGWLRAAVLGANDGIVSTASLIIGMATANSIQLTIVVAGTAGLVAGAISMAAGEYVSVCSQADIEKADLLLEQRSLDSDYEAEVTPQDKLDYLKTLQQQGNIVSQLWYFTQSHDCQCSQEFKHTVGDLKCVKAQNQSL